jgi:hypothetical protein
MRSAAIGIQWFLKRGRDHPLQAIGYVAAAFGFFHLPFEIDALNTERRAARIREKNLRPQTILAKRRYDACNHQVHVALLKGERGDWRVGNPRVTDNADIVARACR